MSLGPPRLASTVRRFCFPVTRISFAASTVTGEGLPARGAATETVVQAHVFAATRETIMALPPGFEGKYIVEGHSPAQWSAGDIDTQQPPDHLVYDGRRFRVITAAPWSEGPSGTDQWWVFTAAEITEDPP